MVFWKANNTSSLCTSDAFEERLACQLTGMVVKVYYVKINRHWLVEPLWVLGYLILRTLAK